MRSKSILFLLMFVAPSLVSAQGIICGAPGGQIACVIPGATATGAGTSQVVALPGVIRGGGGLGASMPTFSFTDSTNTGFYDVGANLASASSGTIQWLQASNVFRFVSTSVVGWSSGDPSGAATDTSLSRPAAGVVGIGNGATSDNVGSLGNATNRIAQGFLVIAAIGTTGTSGSLDLGGNFYWSGYPSLSTSLSGAVCMSASNLVEINTNAGGCLVSALKYKENIVDIPQSDALDLVLKMKPVTYDLIESGDHQFGFIADWTERLDPRLSYRDSKGEISGFRYEQYTAYLTGAIQQLNARIESLEKR